MCRHQLLQLYLYLFAYNLSRRRVIANFTKKVTFLLLFVLTNDIDIQFLLLIRIFPLLICLYYCYEKSSIWNIVTTAHKITLVALPRAKNIKRVRWKVKWMYNLQAFRNCNQGIRDYWITLCQIPGFVGLIKKKKSSLLCRNLSIHLLKRSLILRRFYHSS